MHMKTVVVFNEVARYFAAHPEALKKVAQDYGIDLEDHHEVNPQYWLGEAKESVLTSLQVADLEWVKQDDLVTGMQFTMKNWTKIYNWQQVLSNMICEDYDAPEGEGNGSWERYGLGGDDDVDYNGSYIDCAFALVDVYINYTSK